jgi:tetratricopeptide (TPR) repeat protein
MSRGRTKMLRSGGQLLCAFSLLVLLSSTGRAEPAAEVVRVLSLLDELDVEGAAALLNRIAPETPGYGYASALYSFHRGEYQESASSLPKEGDEEALLKDHVERLRGRLGPVQRAVAGMSERAEQHFIYRYQPGPDSLLPDYARETLEGQRKVLESLYGVAPTLPTVVEFFPDEKSFVAASGLPAEWVRTTGTVAICKWDRILALSPRTLPRGYPWKDTLAHEYVHLVLARASKNRAPVWFHEGSAKLLESAWRDPQRKDFVGPWAESLLARAIAEDSLVGFDDMHPSMAALPSSEIAALAFAQVAWAVNYIFDEVGDEGYRTVVRETSLHGDVFRAIGSVLGESGRNFEQGYRQFLAQQDLKVRAQVAGIDLGLGSGKPGGGDPDGDDLDPILREHRAMQDHARLGDLLRRRGKLRAALLEYERAAQVGPYHSPALANKRARAHRGLGGVERAVALLEESVLLYPEYTPTVTLLAELSAQAGDTARAIVMGEMALGLNPFDPSVHRLLETAYEDVGRLEERDREQRVLLLLERGSNPGGELNQ